MFNAINPTRIADALKGLKLPKSPVQPPSPTKPEPKLPGDQLLINRDRLKLPKGPVCPPAAPKWPLPLPKLSDPIVVKDPKDVLF